MLINDEVINNTIGSWFLSVLEKIYFFEQTGIIILYKVLTALILVVLLINVALLVINFTVVTKSRTNESAKAYVRLLAITVIGFIGLNLYIEVNPSNFVTVKLTLANSIPIIFGSALEFIFIGIGIYLHFVYLVKQIKTLILNECLSDL